MRPQRSEQRTAAWILVSMLLVGAVVWGLVHFVEQYSPQDALAQGLMTTNTIPQNFTGGIQTSSLTVTGGVLATSVIATMPATQTIAAGNTIAADACGGVKRVSAAGAVTTSTSNTFTVTTPALAGCSFLLCNVGAQVITLDKNSATLLVGGVDVALAANSCVGIVNDGTLYRQSSAQLTAT